MTKREQAALERLESDLASIDLLGPGDQRQTQPVPESQVAAIEKALREAAGRGRQEYIRTLVELGGRFAGAMLK